MEIHIITPAAKEQALAIKLFLFLILKNIGIEPITVEKPAKIVKINGYVNKIT